MQHVEIRVKGHVNSNWADSLGKMSVSHTTRGDTVMAGDVRDQATLRGLINRIADLGIELISVATAPRVERPIKFRDEEIAMATIDATRRKT